MTLSQPHTQQSGPDLAFGDLLRVLFKHKSKILGIFLGTIALVTLIVVLIAPVYETTAGLLVKIGREFMPKTDVSTAANLMVVDHEEIINSEVAILKSREVIEQVITQLGVDTLYPEIAQDPPGRMTPEYAAVREFAGDLTVDGVSNSNVIEVSFQHRDPMVATEALNLLIDLYKEKHLQAFSTPDSSFLEQQVDQYRQHLKTAEQELEAFKQQHGVYSLGEQRSLLLKQRVALDTSLKSAQDRVAELNNKVVSYQENLAALSGDTTQYTQSELDKVLVDTQTRLLALRMQEQDLLARGYRPDSRSVGDVRKGISLVNAILSDHERDIGQKVRTGNPVYQELQKELFKARAELNSQRAGVTLVSEQIARLDQQVRSLDEKQNELRDLERAVSINEKNYLTYVEKHEEARISDDLDRQKIANISVIQAPAVPQKPVKPKKGIALLLSTILGLMLGIGYAFVAEILSRGLSTPAQVERRLGLPVLTEIPLKQA